MSLEGVKVGDRIIIKSGYHGNPQVDTVEKITPAGNVKAKGGTIFFPNGRERGNADSWYFKTAHIATEKDIKDIKHRIMIAKLKDTKWDKVSYETAKAILDMVKDLNV